MIEYETKNLGKYVDISNFRVGQKGAFNCIVEKIIQGENAVSVILPTRYGKSDLIRAASIELKERKAVHSSFLVTPSKFLRNQLNEYTKIQEMIKRYNIKTSKIINYDILENYRPNIIQNDETFISLTTQMLAVNIDNICKQIKFTKNNTGKPIVVFIDECHTGSEDNSWGATVEKIKSSGGKVVLCTATPYREKGRIPGFKYVEENTTEKYNFVPRKNDEDETKYWLDQYKTLQSNLKLEADYEYTFARAWKEDIICKMNHRTFDVLVKIPLSENVFKEVHISEMTPSDCAKYYGKIVRDDKVVQAGVSELIERLILYKTNEPTAQGIVFCGNDLNEEEDDEHAKQIRNSINKIDPSIRVSIATSKQDMAENIIKNFGKGQADILIVKQMASVGLDIPNMKIALDLSAVRTFSAFIQRIMRVATVWKQNKVAHLIIPADINGMALWCGFIDGNGGSVTETESQLINSIEKDKNIENKNNNLGFEVLKTENVVLSNNGDKSQLNVSEYTEYVLPLIKRDPTIQATYADSDILKIAKLYAECNKENNSTSQELTKTQINDVESQRKSIKDEIKQNRNKYTNLNHRYSKENKDWVLFHAEQLNICKVNLGINPNKKLEQITNINDLNRILNWYKNRILKHENK
jgi:superfamily II DNA or RNA helicase